MISHSRAAITTAALTALLTLAGGAAATAAPLAASVSAAAARSGQEQFHLTSNVATATRQQVHSGALIAVDFSPRSAGRVAADLANRLLDGRSAGDPENFDLYGGARVTVNAAVARRMAIDVDALAKMGARLE